MGYFTNKINNLINELEQAYNGEATTVIEFIQKAQDTRESVIRAFKNNKIDIDHYMLYSIRLAELSLNNRFRG